MECGASDQTVAGSSDHLGIQVASRTGLAFASPTVPGHYTMNLTATDTAGSGATATIRQWSVVVVDRPHFGQRPGTVFQFTPPLSSAARLRQNWTYTFLPPARSAEPSVFFDNATDEVLRLTPTPFRICGAWNTQSMCSVWLSCNVTVRSIIQSDSHRNPRPPPLLLLLYARVWTRSLTLYRLPTRVRRNWGMTCLSAL
jgi:hypothetical protein